MGQSYRIRAVIKLKELPSWVKKLLLSSMAAFLILFIFCLPSPLFNDPVSVTLLSKDGELLGAKVALDGQWRFPPAKNIPKKFAKAITVFEDKRFYYHFGVDPIAVLRSTYLNIKHKKIVTGASTLTMQTIRLSRKNPARSYFGKLIEMIMATRLELTNKKDSILAYYANNAPFGGNVVGLEAASWRYFGRTPETLTWAETSTLAVLPNSPSLIHPGRNRDKLLKKRNKLLDNLYVEGELTELELEVSKAEPLPVKPHQIPRLAPHFMETAFLKTKKHRLESTLIKTVQTTVTELTKNHAQRLAIQGVNNVAVIVIDNRTFDIIAYIGNSAPFDRSDLSPSVDIITSPRSTGSILKPLLFNLMVQNGYILPDTLIPDIPTQYEGYMPENYDREYRGAIPAWFALARSFNVPAVRMLREFGVERFYGSLKNMGLTTLFRAPEDYGLTLILGGAEGTLYDISSIYANMADIARGSNISGIGGLFYYKKPRILKDDNIETERVSEISLASSYLTLNALVEVIRPKTESFWKNFSSSKRIAWKTGTSYGLRDGWAIGSTTSYTVGVWAGNADGEGNPTLTGIGSAAPLLFDIFNRLEKSKWFEVPESELKEFEVCSNDGYLKVGGCETKTAYGPKNSHFDKLSPNNKLIHMDKTGTWRVHGKCERVTSMIHKTWFTLPPAQEYFYSRASLDYLPLPPYREDCLKDKAITGGTSPIDFLYPEDNTKVYIPLDFASKKSKVVFEAVHRKKDEILFWHLNDTYLSTTKTFHQMEIDVPKGKYRIIVVDKAGNSETRNFEVLGIE